MPAMILPKGSLMSWTVTHDPLLPNNTVWSDISEHNRSELNVSVDRIEKTHRTANGSLRKWHVADKKTWSTSWDMLPHTTTFTVDGKWGGSEIETFYLANPGAFWLSIKLPDTTRSIFRVVFKDFSKSVQKRGRYEFWNIDVSIEEV